MTARSIRLAARMALLGAALAFATVALGQQRTQQPGFPSRVLSGPQKQAQEPPAADAGQGGDSQLSQRVDQLEGQIVDLQIIVGTLESLAKSGAGGAGPGPASAGPLGPIGGGGQDSGRIEALETQVRALSSQIEQMSQHIRALEASLAGAPAPRPGPSFDPRPARSEFDDVPGPGMGPGPGGFGATTVIPGSSEAAGPLPGPDPRGGGVEISELDAGGGGSPKQVYERAYGLLLQQNYAAAESGFQEFLKRYPSDELAANAQYWLGETFFVRGLYKDAAGAFLKGSRTYSKSPKGPDSMLKLAMSLDRLGQRDAACQAYSELGARYPNPPQHVRDRAKSERQRVGCR